MSTNNVLKCKIEKTLKFPSSTVHNLIKRFRESGDISANETDYWHMWKGTINAETFQIQLLEQLMLPSGLCLFQGRSCMFHQESAKPQTASITTVRLQSRRVQVLDWSSCSLDIFTSLKHLAHHEMQSTAKRTQDC